MTVMANWRKSTYSSTSGCVEVGWRKSSHSAAANCVEAGNGILVRDTADRDGPVLAFTPDAWTAFVAAIKEDR